MLVSPTTESDATNQWAGHSLPCLHVSPEPVSSCFSVPLSKPRASPGLATSRHARPPHICGPAFGARIRHAFHAGPPNAGRTGNTPGATCPWLPLSWALTHARRYPPDRFLPRPRTTLIGWPPPRFSRGPDCRGHQQDYRTDRPVARHAPRRNWRAHTAAWGPSRPGRPGAGVVRRTG